MLKVTVRPGESPRVACTHCGTPNPFFVYEEQGSVTLQFASPNQKGHTVCNMCGKSFTWPASAIAVVNASALQDLLLSCWRENERIYKKPQVIATVHRPKWH